MVFLFSFYLIALELIPSDDRLSLYITSTEDATLYRENYTNLGLYTDFQTITINGQVINISDGVFKDSSGLKKITLSQSIQRIGSSCFYGCISLETIQLPNMVKRIESNLFLGCSSLENISLPAQLEYVARGSFNSCNNLNIFIISGNNFFSTGDNGRILIFNKTEAIYAAPKHAEITIPKNIIEIKGCFLESNYQIKHLFFENESSLKTVHQNALQSTSLRSVVFPNGTQSIGGWAFQFSQIINITIPSTLTYVHNNIFDNAGSLQNVFIIGESTAIKIDEEGIIFNSAYTRILFLPSSLSSFKIPANLTNININPIRANRNLLNLTVEDGNTGFNASENVLYNTDFFRLLTPAGGLTEIVVHESCVQIGERAFASMPITSITFRSDNISKIFTTAFQSTRSLKTINLPSKIEYIPEFCFQWSGIESIELPANIQTIDTQSFYQCRLRKIDMRNCINLTKIDVDAFSGCDQLTSVILPPSINILCNKCFTGCAVVNTSFPSTLQYIENRVFDSSSLETVSFEVDDNGKTSLISIGEKAFYSTKIREVLVPDSVQVIHMEAFARCNNLEVLKFSSNSDLEELKADVIAGSNLIRELFLGKKFKRIEEGAISQSMNLSKVVVSTENNDYCSINNIIYLKNASALIACPGGLKAVEIVSEASAIVNKAFFECTLLEEVTFKENSILSSIGASTFFGCGAIRKMTMPTHLRMIEEKAFSGCTELKEILFPDGSELMKIGKEAFAGCLKLANIVPPFCTREIEEGAFKGCIKLHSFVIPKELSKLRSGVFQDCIVLMKVHACLESVPEEFSSDAFTNCPISMCFYVPIKFSSESFCGRSNVVRVLDDDCYFPSHNFTVDINDSLSFAMMLLSPIIANDTEGGKLSI